MRLDRLLDEVLEIGIGAPTEQTLSGRAIDVGVHTGTLDVAMGWKPTRLASHGLYRPFAQGKSVDPRMTGRAEVKLAQTPLGTPGQEFHGGRTYIACKVEGQAIDSGRGRSRKESLCNVLNKDKRERMTAFAERYTPRIGRPRSESAVTKQATAAHDDTRPHDRYRQAFFRVKIH